MQTNEDPTSPRVQRRMLQEMIERFAIKHAVSTDVAKQMIVDRHNKHAQDADDAIAKIEAAHPSPLMEHDTSSMMPDSPTGTT